MPKKADPEILALRKIVRALKPLDGAAIARILRYAYQRYTEARNKAQHAESHAQ